MIIIDADLQDPPSLIPEMIKYWEEGYKDVYAKRENRGRESWLRKQFSLMFYRILDHATRFDILQNVGDFRLLDRQCIEALKKLRESERYTKGLFCWIGFEKKEIIFNRNDRVAGESKWSFWNLFNLAIEGITSFTTTPLRFSTILGTITAFGALCFIIFYISKTLIFGDPVQGFTTLVSVMLFLGGVQLLCIGILGEYIGRIYIETKKRPTYLASEYNEEKVL
jgi:glycosyltransferase involved in cell wall biosynthesis